MENRSHFIRAIREISGSIPMNEGTRKGLCPQIAQRDADEEFWNGRARRKQREKLCAQSSPVQTLLPYLRPSAGDSESGCGWWGSSAAEEKRIAERGFLQNEPILLDVRNCA